MTPLRDEPVDTVALYGPEVFDRPHRGTRFHCLLKLVWWEVAVSIDVVQHQ